MRTLDLPGFSKVSRGKVREIFAVDEHLLMVATDRISAFDVVLPNTIPRKGQVLTQLSAYWFERLSERVPHHLVTTRAEAFPPELRPFQNLLHGRSMLVRRCRPLPVECVVRGYLAGSGWKEYQQTGRICGLPLPPGLSQSEELPEPIFTPASKAAAGHDENISFDEVVQQIGGELAEQVREVSLRIYGQAREEARTKGIIIADTKFEFGLYQDRLLLIDEVLTPDSSRFWPADEYAPGRPQPSFDKQYIRDYLETLDWDKRAPGPELPASVIEATTERYLEAYRRLTGKVLS